MTARPAARSLEARARRLVRRAARDLAAFLLPQCCPGCAEPAEAAELLCPACRALIPRLPVPLCARCLARGLEPVGCTAHPGFALWAAWVYEERAARVVHALKYEGRTRLAAALGPVLAAALPAGTRPDLVLDVPLHPVRLRERGYNQAALLADAVAVHLPAPRLAGALERARATRPQARLDPRARRANVGGAFRVRQPGALGGRSVLIVDDVVTTGATLEACLGALGAAGASAVGLALAWDQ